MRKIAEIKKRAEEKGWTIVEEGLDGLSFRHFGKKRTLIASWGGGWEHVSVNDRNTTPTWEDMCELKDIFWGEEECVIQYHPPKSEYVGNLKHCLHLWKPIEKYAGALPVPDSILVGIKGIEFKEV